MEEVKKRGRPPKATTAVGGTAATSDAETVPTIPKKRGRPIKAKGRGRPPKRVATPTSDGEEPDANGGAVKLVVVATGKGRGRPRKVAVSESESGDESKCDDSKDSSYEESKPKPQKSPSSAERRKLGRPKKHQASDEDEDSDNDDDEERRPVGRPATGAINLNIVRSGRGPGRPKKGEVLKRAAPGDSNGDAAAPKKRGRPSLGNKTPVVPSGKPRGRPKTLKSPQADVDDDEEADEHDAGSDGELPAATPKKRGRPSLTGKPRGRPKANTSVAHSEDEQDDAAEKEDQTASGSDVDLTLAAPKKRGRPALGKPHGRPKANNDEQGEDAVADKDEKEESDVGAEDHVQKSKPEKNKSLELDDSVEDSVEEISDAEASLVA